MSEEIKSKEELLKKLDVLGDITEEQRNRITCELIGHSRIQTFCFGYYNCARCEEQLGDSLAGVYQGAPDTVIVGHKCPTCEENYKKLTWMDKIFCPDPFADEKPNPLEVLNSMGVVEYDCDDGEVLYILVENSEENIELLKEIGATEEDIEEMREGGDEETLEISQFAFYKTGICGWQSSKGFLTREQCEEIELL